MYKHLKDVQKFHEKHGLLASYGPALISTDRSEDRYRRMREEIEEYQRVARGDDIAAVAKELADILYTVYGTIVEHGLQGEMQEIFEEVHRSNMSRDPGKHTAVKGENYEEANIERFLDT